MVSGPDTLLVLGFVNETLVLSFAGDEDSIEEVDALPGFRLDVPTLDAGSLVIAGSTNTALFQVTRDGVMTARGPAWTPSSGGKVTLAVHDDAHILVATSGGGVTLLSGPDAVVGSYQAPHEIACAALHKLPNGEQVIALGLWTSHDIHLLSAPSLEPLATVALESPFLIRSLQLSTFADGATYLFAGRGDGTLVSLPLDDTAPYLRSDSSLRKAVVLGTQPIVMTPFTTSDGSTSVLVASDRPTVISRTNGRLAYSSVNLRDVQAVATFSPVAFPNALVLAQAEGLRIGRIDDTQKLQIRSLSLEGDQPRGIAYAPRAQVYGVACLREDLDRRTGVEVRSASVRVLDGTSFETLSMFELEEHEQALSIATVDLGPDGVEHFIVGTGIVRPDEKQPRRGRVVAFACTSEGATQRDEFETRGAAFAIAPLADGVFAVAVNSQVFVLGWSVEGHFDQLASWGGSFMATSLIARGDQLVVGDALRSIVLLRWDARSSTLTEIAREHHTYGVTAVQALSDDTFIAADQDLNLLTVQRTTEAGARSGEEELSPLGLFRSGEYVTRFVPGTLVPSLASSATDDAGLTARMLVGTSSGALAVLADLSPPTAKLLSDLERNLRRVGDADAVGGLDHAEWRAYASGARRLDARGFIDGAFVERFADLSDEAARKVLEGASEHERIDVPLAEVRRIVEAVERLH